MDDTLVLTGEADTRAYNDVMDLAKRLHAQVPNLSWCWAGVAAHSVATATRDTQQQRDLLFLHDIYDVLHRLTQRHC
jgi:hypothetical protein